MSFILFVLAQAGTAPRLESPPVPPPMVVDPQSLADRLRRECLSEAGIALIVADALRRNEPRAMAERRARSMAIEQELGAASFADPLDLDRLARAKTAYDANQNESRMQSTRDEIALIRRLSSADRTIFARRFTVMRPILPPKTCPPAR